MKKGINHVFKSCFYFYLFFLLIVQYKQYWNSMDYKCHIDMENYNTCLQEIDLYFIYFNFEYVNNALYPSYWFDLTYV